MYPDGQDKIILNIKDTGIGLPQELDIHNAETMGMQVVSDLVKRLNGTIELDGKNGIAWWIMF